MADARCQIHDMAGVVNFLNLFLGEMKIEQGEKLSRFASICVS